MIIICCGMMRSGSTLQYQITSELVSTRNLGKCLGWVDLSDEKNIKKLPSDNCFNVLKCHDYNYKIFDLIDPENIKLIYSYRDIRDVAVSLKNKYELKFKNIIPMINSCLNNYYHWNNNKLIVSSKYERFINNIKNEVLKISNFLHIDVSDEIAEQIADKYSIINNKERIKNFDFKNSGTNLGNSNNYDPVSLLHYNHINNGDMGQWKNEFSHIQLSILENIAESWLKDHEYHFSQNYLNRKIVGRVAKHLLKTFKIVSLN